MSAALTRDALHMPQRREGPALEFASQPTIRTGRLVLRKIKPEDQYRIAAAMQNEAIVRMLTVVPIPYDHHDALEWIKSWESGENDGWVYANTFDGGALEGVVSIERHEGPRPGWHLGYWLRQEHWGEGYISEASSAVIERFLSRMVGEVLLCGAIADNPASLKVQEKLGFQITGMRDVYSRSRMEMVPLVESELTFGSFMPV